MNKLVLGASASVLVLALHSAAHAQAPAPSAGGPELEEVVVTAQKRTERLQDVPVSATVVATTALSTANATTVSDLNRIIPSVQLKGSFNGRVPMAMRGISTNAQQGQLGLTSGVLISIDGVPVPSDSFGGNQLNDVAQVEVLRGPQATLGGRTASAGQINVVTKGPSKTWTATASAMATDDDERRFNAYIAGPITDQVQFSVTGYAGHLDYPVKNRLTGKDSVNNELGGRVKLHVDFNENFDATLMGRVSRFTSRGENYTYQYLTPGVALFGVPQSVLFPGVNIRYGNTDYASPVNMFSQFYDSDASLTFNYRVGDWTLSSITARQHEKQNFTQDIFGVGVFWWNISPLRALLHAPSFDNTSYNSQKVDQTSQEFRIVSPAEAPISFVGGLFYSSARVRNASRLGWILNAGNSQSENLTRTYDIYGRVTAKVREDTKLLVGLRYNIDKVRYDTHVLPLLIDGLTLPNCGALLSCDWSREDTSYALVGDVTLQHNFTPDIMGYATYARGYKPRVFPGVAFHTPQNAPSAANAASAALVRQEHIDSFEVGAKSRLGRALTFNASVFNTIYNNFQVQTTDQTQVIAVSRVTAAGKARTRGVEADLAWRATDTTTVTASAAYIDAKFVRFTGASCYATQTVAQGCVNGLQDMSGRPLPDSPKFKASLNVDQRVPLSSMPFDLVLNGNLAYRTSTPYLHSSANPFTRQPGFALVNLGVSAQSHDQRWTLTAFVNNVTDKFYLVDAQDFFSGAYTGGIAVVGQPARDSSRYFGIRLDARY